MGHNLSSIQKGIRAQESSFSYFVHVREERKEKGEPRAFFSRSTKLCRSEFVKPRVKVLLLIKSNACAPEKRDFTKDPREEFGVN